MDKIGIAIMIIASAAMGGMYFLAATPRGERILRRFVARHMAGMTPAERLDLGRANLDGV